MRFEDVSFDEGGERTDEKTFDTGTIQFSGVRPDELLDRQYTLVTVVTDVTGSVQSFASDLRDLQKMVAQSCQDSRRVPADNILIRQLTFNSQNGITEVHGFRLASEIDVSSDYPELTPAGLTPLYEAVFNALEATLTYAEELTALEFRVNAIIPVITDGCDNQSDGRFTPPIIKERMEKAVQGEMLESCISYLIGVNTLAVDMNGQSLGDILQQFADQAGFTTYIDAREATPQKLGSIGQLISSSVSAQAQAIGTGMASAPILTLPS